MLSRKLDIPISELAIRGGLISLVAGVSGTLLCGLILDRLTVKRGVVPLAQVGLVITGLSTALMAYVDESSVALSMYAVYCAIGGILLLRVTPRHLMGRITAINLIIPGIDGSLGPTLTAAIAQGFFSGKAAIANAYSVVALVLTVVGIFVLIGLNHAIAKQAPAE